VAITRLNLEGCGWHDTIDPGRQVDADHQVALALEHVSDGGDSDGY
jgi:hypothetical protein